MLLSLRLIVYVVYRELCEMVGYRVIKDESEHTASRYTLFYEYV